MNKAELIDAIADSAKISKADANRALDATISSITRALKKGDGVTLVGFGSFSVVKRAARPGRNPQTGKAMHIKSKKVAKFKAGIELRTAVNK
jgi:DNA-binding protein HU-beta